MGCLHSKVEAGDLSQPPRPAVPGEGAHDGNTAGRHAPVVEEGARTGKIKVPAHVAAQAAQRKRDQQSMQHPDLSALQTG